MSQVFVILRHIGTDERIVLNPGDFIGRANTAAMYIDDPRVSEAHAMISLREHCLKLLSLRGRFRHNGKVLTEVHLRPGMILELAEGVEVVCEEVYLPQTALGLLLWPGPLEVPLSGTTTVYIEGGQATVRRGHDPNGDLVIWAAGHDWRAQVKGQKNRSLTCGDKLMIREVEIEIVKVSLSVMSQDRTLSQIRGALTLRHSINRVTILTDVGPPHIISGIPGKLLASLLARGGAADWRDVVSDVWPNDLSSASSLRRRFDTGLRRLRETMSRLVSTAEDFLKLDGAGILMISLGREDRIECAND